MSNKQIVKNLMFKDFGEYWYFAKHLSTNQRHLVFDSLSSYQQKLLNSSFVEGGWEDVFSRNIIDELLEVFENKYHYNFLDIKYRVTKNKSVYLPKKIWYNVLEDLSQFHPKHTTFLLGGIKTIECKQNKDIVLLVPNSSTFQD